MNWKGRRVLVTGAGGFIGSQLVEKLLELGAETRAFVHYRSDGSWGWLDETKALGNLTVIPGDVRDREILKTAMRESEVVFHLAALIAIPYSYQAPFSYIQTNVEGTANALQIALEANVERFVHASTSEVYGTARYVPIDESHQLVGQTPYSASKIAADKMVEAYYYSFGLPVSIARPFNTFGPRQSARAVIPTIISQALAQTQIKLGNLEPTRDFTYVDDIVSGYLDIANSSDALGQVINLGSGKEISIGCLANLILDILGNDSKVVESDPERLRLGNSEVDRLCADNKRALELLGWCPQVSLREGLTTTIAWIKANIERFRTDDYAI